MISATQNLQSPEGTRRFMSFASTAGTSQIFHQQDPNAGGTASPLDDDDYFVILPGSWFAYRVPAAGAAVEFRCFSYRRIAPSVNGPGVQIMARIFDAGEDTLTKANLRPFEFRYSPDHFAQFVPFSGHIFAPDEVLGLCQNAGVGPLNSFVWSLHWLQADDPGLLLPWVSGSPGPY